MATSKDKAKEARNIASSIKTSISAQNTVKRNAKAANIDLKPSEKRKAAEVIQGTMKAERERTASRAEYASRRDAANAAKARMVAGITGAGAKQVNPIYRNTETNKQPRIGGHAN